MFLSIILRDSNYKLTQFAKHIDALEARIQEKQDKNGKFSYVTECLAGEKIKQYDCL
jgi:hypothetical protein